MATEIDIGRNYVNSLVEKHIADEDVVKENSKKAFEAEFKIKESGGYGEHDSRIKLEWDKKDGDIVIKLEDGSDEYVIKGNLTQKADKLTFLLTA